MSAVQVEFPVTPAQLEAAEECLLALGCQAISLISAADEPVLEPAPGETPLWDSVTLRAWFSLDTHFGEVREHLLSLFPELEIQIEFVGDQDWQLQANNYAVDQLFADRLWLMPKSAQDRDLPEGVVPLHLEPGLAFGSGSHATTALCLEWLAQHIQAAPDNPVRVMDFGCGSGVLGVAAALLGAQVVGVDHDPQAVVATQENAAYNGVADRVQVYTLDEWQAPEVSSVYSTQKPFDVIVANILAAPLQELATHFESICRPGAFIVLSGILQEQAEPVMQYYHYTDFVEPRVQEGWVLLAGQKVS